MNIDRLILIETSSPGNLGAALRVAANFGVPMLALVRPRTETDHPDVDRWACGAREHVRLSVFDSLSDAAGDGRTLVATASGRGRPDQPVVSPSEAVEIIGVRGPDTTALVFGSETRGMSREDLDRCDVVVRIPTRPEFPVLNLVQAIAVLLGRLADDEAPRLPGGTVPATHEQVEGLMGHLRRTLTEIGYLDPVNPDRILRKIRRVFGRAGLTDNEVAIFRGICRQIDWACGDRSAEARPGGRFGIDES